MGKAKGYCSFEQRLVHSLDLVALLTGLGKSPLSFMAVLAGRMRSFLRRETAFVLASFSRRGDVLVALFIQARLSLSPSFTKGLTLDLAPGCSLVH